jgi:hypothetical protein
MPTSRPFAYNTGSTIAGTTQVGSLAVGTPTSGFTGSPKWWNGPDENLGYVIAIPVSANTQPTPVSGVTASVGFNRTSGLTESSFISLTNNLFNQSYASGVQAGYWLNLNGYWNSYNQCGNNLIDNTNLIGYWKLDSNGNDSSGLGRNLTTVGSVTYSNGYLGSGATCTDTSSYLYQNTFNFPSTNSNLSVSFWFKMSNLTTSTLASGGEVNLINYKYSNTGWRSYIRRNPTTNNFVIHAQVGNDSAGGAVGTTYPYNDTWVHYTFTFNDTSNFLAIYINGSYAAGITANNTIIQSTQYLTFFNNTPASSSFSCAFDEVGIWSRELTADEIATLYTATCPIKL